MTTEQLQTIKAEILADPILAAHPNNGDGNFAIAEALNLQASPDYWVWRTDLTKSEITDNVSVDDTTFIWAGNGFIGRSVGELTCWNELFSSGTCNPSKANVRQAFADIFSGSGNAANNRAHLLAIGRRLATRVEQLLATGTGSAASPGIMSFEGLINGDEVQAARDLP